MRRSYLPYFTSLLLFGANGIVASRIGLPSDKIVLLRTLIGSLLLASLFLLTKQKPIFHQHKRDLAYLAVSGMAMGASWMLLYEAYGQVGVGVSSLLYYCGPVIVMILSPVLFRERLTWAKITGFLAVLCGIFLVNGQALNETENAFGLLCGGLSAVMYAIMVLCNKKSRHITGMENAVLQLAFGFLFVAVFVGVKSGYAFSIASGDWLWIGILGLLNTGVGCYFYFLSIGRLPVQTVAVCGYLEPLSAVLFSVVFLNETLSPLQLLGGGLILGGAVFGECFFQRLPHEEN